MGRFTVEQLSVETRLGACLAGAGCAVALIGCHSPAEPALVGTPPLPACALGDVSVALEESDYERARGALDAHTGASTCAATPELASLQWEVDVGIAALREPSLRAAAQWLERARTGRPAERAGALRIARALLGRLTREQPTRVVRSLDPAVSLGETPFIIGGRLAPTATTLGVFAFTTAGVRLYSLDSPTVPELGATTEVVQLRTGAVRTLAEDAARWTLTSQPDGGVLVDAPAAHRVVDDVAGLLAAHRVASVKGELVASLDVVDLVSGAPRGHWDRAPIGVSADPQIVFDRAGKRLAIAVEGRVSVASLPSGRFEDVMLPETHPPSGVRLAFTEDGTTLCFEHLGVASLLSTGRPRPIPRCAFHEATAHHRDAAPLSPIADGSWAAATGVAPLGMLTHELGAAAISRSRQLAAWFEVEAGATKRYRVRVFDATSGKTVRTAQVDAPPVDVELRFSSDDGVVGWSYPSGVTGAFEVATGREVPFPELSPACSPSSATVTCVVREPRGFCAFGDLFAPQEVCPATGP